MCSENKGADQLCDGSENKGADQLYRTADLRLCFRICKKPIFSQRGSYVYRFYSVVNHKAIIYMT